MICRKYSLFLVFAPEEPDTILVSEKLFGGSL